MDIDDDAAKRLQDEEHPGSEFESALDKDTLSDVVKQAPLVVEASTPLAQTISEMQEQRRGCALVAENGKLTGIFTERDVLMRVAGKGLDAEQTPVSTCMTADPVTLPGHSSLAHALNLMVIEGFRHIPIVDVDRRPACCVTGGACLECGGLTPLY